MKGIAMSRALQITPGRLWASYLRKLNRQPVQTKVATSVFAAILGDAIAQHASKRRAGDSWKYDYLRTARISTFNGALGALGHYYYGLLDKRFTGKAPHIVVLKVMIDQLLFSPVCTMFFYVYKTLLEGRPREFYNEVQEKYVPTVVSGWSLWVPAHILNFAVIPTQHRILYANVISIGGCFLLSRASSGDYSKKKKTKAAAPLRPAPILAEGEIEVLMDVNVKLD